MAPKSKLSIFLFCFLLTAPLVLPQARERGSWNYPVRDQSEKVIPLEWGLPAAAHLMRRAGFSASPEELQRIVDEGFEATLNELLDYEAVDNSAMEEGLAARGYSLVELIDEGSEGFSYGNPLDMNRWWFYRMINSRHQLLEKMTFFWHDHFSTSLEAVPFVGPNDLPLLINQNQTLRTHALGNFKEMVLAVARDPAMIIFLDNFTNVAGNPNENWARELFELFTMGEGNGYTEKDVQEAARAFTGWSLEEIGSFSYYFFLHDFGPKTVLGETWTPEFGAGDAGLEDGQRVIDIIFEQPVVAEFIARKLWEYFVYPDPHEDLVSALGDVFRESGYEIKVLMRAIFEHPHFMSEKAYRAKIKSPAEWVCNFYREMELSDPDNLPIFLFFFDLGQLLFLPPDVGGWPHDRGWINTGTVLGRSNVMMLVTSNRPGFFGEISNGEDMLDLRRIVDESQVSVPFELVDLMSQTLVQGDLSVDSKDALLNYLLTDDDGLPAQFDLQNDLSLDKKMRGLIHLITLMPVYQLN